MKLLRIFAGIIAGNLAGLLLCLLVVWTGRVSVVSALVVIYPSLVLVPFAMGLVAALVWQPLNLPIGRCVIWSLLSTAVGLGGAWKFLHEGSICLLIISPVLYVFLLGGVLVGRIWFRARPDKLNLCLLPVVSIIVLAEPLTRSDRQSVVTDEILIHAPPGRVWPHVTSFPEIRQASHFWLFDLGLPMPMATTAQGDFVGADRRCIFSKGAVFKETVTEIVPRQKLIFDTVESPRDPELIGHLTPQRGQFELRDNHDGTTTLIGRTWYVWHVRPLWYFDWWTRHIFRAVHYRVMENIRTQAERGS